MSIRPQRVTDTARNLIPIASARKPPAALKVPVPVWKNGMYCIDMPELTPPGGAMTRIWACTEAVALAERAKALKSAARLGLMSVGERSIKYTNAQRRQWSSGGHAL